MASFPLIRPLRHGWTRSQSMERSGYHQGPELLPVSCEERGSRKCEELTVVCAILLRTSRNATTGDHASWCVSEAGGSRASKALRPSDRRATWFSRHLFHREEEVVRYFLLLLHHYDILSTSSPFLHLFSSSSISYFFLRISSWVSGFDSWPVCRYSWQC